MMWLVVMSYFLLACAVAACWLLPGVRERLSRRITAWVSRTRTRGACMQSSFREEAQGGWLHAGESAREGRRWLARHGVALTLAMLLLSAPPILMYLLRAEHTAEAFDDSETPQSVAVVTALLHGEHLVPPPALPPDVFTTADVEQVRPQLGTADRRWDRMDADFQQRVLLLYRLMREEHGYEMVLLEGYRSPERQAFLASMGSNVTHAGPWQSYHQYGHAADSAFLRDGKLVISERDPWAMRGYELYGEVAQRLGLTWGGRWKNADLGHIELRRAGVIQPKVGG
jgi:peptidoglycan LD-endopeptidase CwlK